MLLLLLGQSADFIISAANLIRAGDLQVFRLEIDLISIDTGKILAVDKVGFGDDAPQCAPGLFESFDGQHIVHIHSGITACG